MITLIGHGYIGKNIEKQLRTQNFNYTWINHQKKIPEKTEFIINAAGYTGVYNVDDCETYRQECVEGNIIWPLNLEKTNPKIPIIHISSGCIYNGYPNSGYTEKDPPNINFNNGSFYSGCKALEQELLQSYMNKSYLFRIRMPFGKERDPKNFLTKIESYKKLISFENSLTCVEDLVKVIIYFYKQRPDPGIYNVCNPGTSNAKTICDMMNLKKEWFTLEEFESVTKAPRSNCALNTDKLNKILKVKNVNEALEYCISHYN